MFVFVAVTTLSCPFGSLCNVRLVLVSLVLRYLSDVPCSRVAAGFSSYEGEFRLPVVLAQGSPIFHSSC